MNDHRKAGPARWLTPARRKRVYLVIAAAGPLLGFYGLMAQDEFALWLGFAGTVLGAGGNGLAAANTPPAEA